MDQIKKAMGSGSGNQASGNAAGGAEKQDYGDKGLDFAEKKAGMSQSRETNEKIVSRPFCFHVSGKGGGVVVGNGMEVV
jgi:hypothetical protein